MKIIVYCPGAWSHGLNSPERGEGRWAQNFARMAAAAGHDVYATSGGVPNQKEHFGVKLLSEIQVKAHGKFDLYFDASWWEGKEPLVKADKYFAVVWQLESRFYSKDLPSDMYIGFPFDFQADCFKSKTNPWRGKTFCLPARYCETVGEPHFGKKSFVWPCRNAQAPECSIVIKALNKQYVQRGLRGIWMNASNMDEHGVWSRVNSEIIQEKLNMSPYNVVREAIDKASVIVPVNSRSSVLDAITLGVAPLAYASGVTFPYVRKVAKDHGLLVPAEFTVNHITDILDRLLTDKELYHAYVGDLQKHVYPHTQAGAQEKFEEMLDRVN